MSEKTSSMAEAPVCSRVEGIDDNGIVGSVRRAHILRKDDRGIHRVRIIQDASKGSETTTEATGDRRRAQGIYDNDGGVGRGR